MTDANGPDREASWPARAGRFVLMACVAGGIKVYRDSNAPPLPPSLVAPARSPLTPLSPKVSPEAVARAEPPASPAWPGDVAREALAARALGPASIPAEALLAIAPADGVDERLFLMRALETLYGRWPAGVDDPAALRAAIDELRREATRHRRYIEERGLDARIAGLFGDLEGLLDDYEVRLARAGRIEREGAARAGRERLEGVTRSSFSGGVLAGRALHDGATGPEALVAWAGATLIGSAMDELGKAPRRDEARREALEANAPEFRARFDAATAAAEVAALALGERHGWAAGEAGFDATPEQARRATEVIARGDAAGLARLLDAARPRRPRDPFLRGAAAFQGALALGPSATPETLSAASEECLAAAALVPAGAFYDPYRADFLALAGYLANAAALRELGGRGWSAAPTPGGPRALAIWRAFLAADPRDPTGEAREQLAWALASTGRLSEATAAATRAAGPRGADAEFAYGYACLLSLTGATGDSLAWLEHAFRDCHYPDILRAGSDPDLAEARAREAARFADLAAVKFEWSIDWGVFDHDDICLVNRSPFPLTGVSLEVAVDAPGSARWSKALTAERVEPGATHRWKAWVSARAKGAGGKATLNCDQRR